MVLIRKGFEYSLHFVLKSRLFCTLKSQATMCFLKMVPSAICVLWDRLIVFIERVDSEGTVFMKSAVVEIFLKKFCF